MKTRNFETKKSQGCKGCYFYRDHALTCIGQSAKISGELDSKFGSCTTGHVYVKKSRKWNWPAILFGVVWGSGALIPIFMKIFGSISLRWIWVLLPWWMGSLLALVVIFIILRDKKGDV